MKKCHRPEWSQELSDYCDCDSISYNDMSELWDDVCPNCKWFFDAEDLLEESDNASKE